MKLQFLVWKGQKHAHVTLDVKIELAVCFEVGYGQDIKINVLDGCLLRLGWHVTESFNDTGYNQIDWENN